MSLNSFLVLVRNSRALATVVDLATGTDQNVERISLVQRLAPAILITAKSDLLFALVLNKLSIPSFSC